MSKPLKLSHSAMQKYQTCPRMYDLHYNHKIRSVTESSALFFGTAMDLAIGEVLKTKLEGYTGPVKDPIEAFETEWEKHRHNPNISYFKNDFSEELYNPDEDMTGTANPSWLCLLVKGPYMIRAFIEDILPQIKRVISLQEEILLIDAEGNIITGFIDAEVELQDGSIRVMDVKTASNFSRYGEGCVQFSEQLAVYTFFKDILQACFAVLSKDIRSGKRPAKPIHAKTRLVLGDVVPEFQQDVLHAFGLVAAKIKNEEFPMNLNSCDNQYGKPCPYKNFCFGGSMEGLCQKEKK